MDAANGATGANSSEPHFDIPKECKAGVVVDEGPNFRVEVQMVPVPEIGRPYLQHSEHFKLITECRPRGRPDQAQRHRHLP